MKRLTMDMVNKNKMSAIDCVKFFKPNWSVSECDFYLWENTCYPFSPEIMIAQLNEKLINDEKSKDN